MIVPTNDVAPNTTSCNNRVGFGVVSDDLIPNVLLIFREQVLLMRSCAVHLIPTDPALFTIHSVLPSFSPFTVPSGFFTNPLVQTHDPFQAVITRSEYLGVVHKLFMIEVQLTSLLLSLHRHHPFVLLYDIAVGQY